ncbi:hypothetical protein COU57_03860 [Candidatus Pacearchaeota archaeon CG10_big_fil_rev_8_21_14_0_10_32_14]|nr:MAG: hypothetical protein COU57_03860 [Candidatus Pacearchaeota archaeon CG10_big_fil_rev_8_21_14_0_10_32_14]
MNVKRTLVVLGVTFILGVLLVSAISASGFGFGKGFNKNLTPEEQTALQEQHYAIRNAIEEEDFETWKTLMNERIELMQSEITQENFDAIIQQHQQMQEFHEAMQEVRETGDYSRVEHLQEEYGIEFPGKGYGRGMHRMMFSN